MIGDAVARMHVGMDVPFSGDADTDFARMMIPHHQGAIDMAIAELRYGKDKRLKRLAQEIVSGTSATPGSPVQVQLADQSDRGSHGANR